MRSPLRIAFALSPLVAAVSAASAAGEEIDPAAQLREELLNAERGAWGAVPIFFPPEPPPLESLEESADRRRWETYGRLRPPPELAAYVGEPFYPALSTLLAMHDLGRWSRRRIEDYHAAKVKLQEELRAELRRLRDAPVDVRRERLAAFAREQTPKIAALEKTAENLRESFTRIDYRWGVLRDGRLGQDSRHPDSADEVADVMRAAAYYEGGLLPAQRRFLREIALELPLAAHTLQEAVAAQPESFFSPGLARVRWRDDVPDSLARKIAGYQAQRSALKKELYDVVFKADRTWLSMVRSVQLYFTLGPQAGALDQLEALAEEIRRDLAQLPAAGGRGPKIPAAITQRIETMLVAERTLCAGTAEAIEAIRRHEPSLEISYAFEPAGLQFAVHPHARPFLGVSAGVKRRSKETETEIAALAAAYRQSLAGLDQERAAIRATLARTLGLEEQREIEETLAAATRAAFQQENDGPFRAYYNAVFEPGLSPEQRRLLLDSAIQQLLLPLPAGEYQPQ